MAKLYFKYGAMGSSKSAQALIAKFNYEEQGMRCWLIKPSVDTRDGADVIRSRIGLSCSDELRDIVDTADVPVMCFGLRTDFQTHLFPGARRLMEVADSITEIKTICTCGRKAVVNARLDGDGNILTQGEQVLLGGNDRYTAMCHRCWMEKIQQQAEARAKNQ
jgi:thymidine kinase